MLLIMLPDTIMIRCECSLAIAERIISDSKLACMTVQCSVVLLYLPVKYFSYSLISFALLEHHPCGGGMSQDVSADWLHHWTEHGQGA